jgi:hypothetical protein
MEIVIVMNNIMFYGLNVITLTEIVITCRNLTSVGGEETCLT